jgi:putative phage-type endonuclease
MTLTPEQVEARAERIGGSECAVVFGQSKYKTGYQLYLEKRGEWVREPSDSEAIWLGNQMEPVIRQWFSNKTGDLIRQPTGSIVHPDYPWMVAHIDGYREIDGRYRGFEGKSITSREGWGREKSDEVPLDAYLQCQHYMAVCEWDAFDVVRFDGHRILAYEIRADKDLQSKLIQGECEFMERVRSGNPPPLDYSHSTSVEVIKRLYPGTDGRWLVAPPNAIEWRNQLEEANEMESRAKKVKQTARTALLGLMGEAAVLQFPDGFSYRRKRVDRGAYTVDATSYIDFRLAKTANL